jgi:VanZ family protein
MISVRGFARLVSVALAVFIVFATLSPIDLRPETGLPAYAERFGAFFALSLTATLGWPKRRLTALTLIVIAAAALEAMQNLTPTRHGRVLDALEKALGAGAGLLAAEIFEGACRLLLLRGKEPPTPGST